MQVIQYTNHPKTDVKLCMVIIVLLCHGSKTEVINGQQIIPTMVHQNSYN